MNGGLIGNTGGLIEDIGGLTSQIEELKKLIEFALFDKDHPQSLFGILLHGPKGTGKTMVIKALSEALTPKVKFFNVNGDMLSMEPTKEFRETPSKKEKETGEIVYKSKLDRLFKIALQYGSCVIFINNIHRDCPNKKNLTDKETNYLNTMVDFLDERHEPKRILLIAATDQLDSVNLELRIPGHLEEEIEFPVPSLKDRVDILTRILAKVTHSIPSEVIKEIAENTYSFTGADLNRVYRKSRFFCFTRGSNIINESDLKQAVRTVRPSAMKEITLEIPKVYWSDIGGMHNVKERLMEAVVWPLKHAESFARMCLKPSRGILMYGPPGCSKTMIGKALATESQLNFIAVKGPELFNKYVGESEKAVREIFRKAKQASPSIIFFDELDALATERGGGSSATSGCSVGDRVLAQLLTEMDGVEQLDGVTIVAATNRPDKIDMALRRPGRLDEIIYVPLPDYETRREIFSITTKKIPVSSEVIDNIDFLAERTSGYSGAEIIHLCKKATYSALRQDINAEKVELIHFLEAFKQVLPRTTKESIDFYKNFEQESLENKPVMRDITLEGPKVYWSDIGGLHIVKEKVMEAVVWRFEHAKSFAGIGIKPKGILMYGPSGCSKTMIGRALATECKLNFIAVKGAQLFDKYVDESEKAVREIFRKAKQAAPAIIFFDEIDTMILEKDWKSNSSSVCSVGNRVLAQLLTEIDAIEEIDGVTIVAATNRLDKIDQALLRPGRLDEIIYVPLPDHETRREIFSITTKKIPVSSEVIDNIDFLAERTSGYSGAEIIHLCRKAARLALKQNSKAQQVELKHFHEALDTVLPTTTNETITLCEDFAAKLKT